MNKTPKQAVDAINSEYYIPSIQRRFVWETEQICMLFDSLMRDFPIGQMLIKGTNKEDIEDSKVYNFVTDYVVDDVNINGANHHNMNRNDEKTDPISLVFDGQQRLTALNIALNGSIYERKRKSLHKNPENYVRKVLCLNVISNPEKDVQNTDSFDQSKGGDSPQYEFSFKKSDQAYQIIDKDDEKRKFWYPVKDILDEDDIPVEVDDKYKKDMTSEEETMSIKNLTRLHSKIHGQECIDIKKVTDKDRDDMLEIFVRMNRSGTQISDTNTALSVLTYRWEQNGSNITAREQVEQYASELNNTFSDGNPISNQSVLKAAMTCANDKKDTDEIRAPRIRINKFTDSNNSLPSDILEIWKKGKIQQSMNKYVELVRELGVPGKKIDKTMIMCPILYFIHNSQDKNLFDQTSKQGVKNRQKILYWICSTHILSVTSGPTMKLSKEIMKIVDGDNSSNFPLEDISKGINYSIKFNNNTIHAQSIYEDYYNKKYAVFMNILLNVNDISRNDIGSHNEAVKDHIFPKSKIEDMNDEHRLGNIQHIPDEVNAEKHDEDYTEWINSRTDNYKDEYFIPMDDSLYYLDSYEEFCEKREKKINRYLTETSEKLINGDSCIDE